MVISSLILITFAILGAILTLSEYEILVVFGGIIVCLCFLLCLALCILWQLSEITANEKRLSAQEDFIKYLKDKCDKKEEE